MKNKVALITGMTGQDGAYLVEFLLDKDYEVHGIKRRSSSINTDRVNHIFQEVIKKNKKFILHHGDMNDYVSLLRIIKETKPSEIYNLAAQSHVAVSFELPEYTANADALGVLRILEAIKNSGLKNKVKFYQASTSELYGNSSNKKFQDENTPFNPASPYGVAKLYGHWITKNYRESYKMHACNGILFNHESPRRGETFVTRKITIGLSKIKKGKQNTLYLGNLDAKRDWGHARDYVEAMWKILQCKNPDDYVVSTGKTYTVREFVEVAGRILGFRIIWKNKGIKEIGIDQNTNKIIIRVNKKYLRPTDVNYLRGNFSKIRKKLGWKPKISFHKLVKEMVDEDYKNLT